jgi:Patatin-like phospholipase
MPFDQSDPDPAIVKQWFLDNASVAPGTFELALVLGGTVSAGAYTAGALDFLIEALDCWEAVGVGGDPPAPRHRVVLKVVTGTSGGGVNAAIAARALNFAFPTVPQGRAVDAARSGNPFYDTWVHDLRLDRFLALDDRDKGFVSILNGVAIDESAGRIASFAGAERQPRAWVGAPLRLVITLTNLAGVPYRLAFPGDLAETFIDHADYVRFAVAYPEAPAAPFRPDELVLDFGQGVPGAIGWEQFAEFAKATAAFPAGFPPRELARPAEHYRWRILPRPDPPAGRPPYFVLRPDWPAMEGGGAVAPDGSYAFLAMDGGATDNEPIGLAHTALCGILESNPRAGDAADRGILLIDPFAGRAPLGPHGAGSFADNLGSLIGTLIQQTRYDSRDVALAAEENVFSRFLLAPRQPQGSRRPAIASGGLGAFIGFACADFMRYDYMLGRRDCRDYLYSELALPESNAKVFGGPWTAAQKEAYAQGAGPGFLPLIPLIGTAAQAQDLDPWPAGRLDPEIYRGAIERRLRALLEAAAPASPLGWLKKAAWLGGLAGAAPVADKVIEAMRAYLREAELS